jgi:hypothetical protein
MEPKSSKSSNQRQMRNEIFFEAKKEWVTFNFYDVKE